MATKVPSRTVAYENTMAADAHRVGRHLHLQIRMGSRTGHRRPIGAEIYFAISMESAETGLSHSHRSNHNPFNNPLIPIIMQQSEFVRRYVKPYGSSFKPVTGRKRKSKPGPTIPLRPKTPVRPLYSPEPPPYAASSHRVVHVGEFMQALTGVIHTPERGETFRTLFGENAAL